MKILKVLAIVITFLIGITALMLGLLYHHRNIEKKTLTDNERKNTPGSYIKLSVGITHYELAGPDTGKVVVLVNGFSVPYYIWDGTYQYLVKKGFRVLRFDAYGRGYSDRPSVTYNKDLYINQLHDLITGLKIKTPFSIMGVSFGGEVTTDFTCEYPALINKVVLVDPGFERNNKKPRAITTYDEATHAYERAMSQLNDFKYPQKHQEWVYRYTQQMYYKGFREALVSTMYDYKDTEAKSLKCLNDEHKPILLVWGEDDQTVPIANSNTIRKILKTEFLPVSDAGHLPYLEQPEKVNPKISAFLRK